MMLSLWLPVVISSSVWSSVLPQEMMIPQSPQFRNIVSADFYIKHEAKPYSDACHIRSSSGEISFSLRCAEGK